MRHATSVEPAPGLKLCLEATERGLCRVSFVTALGERNDGHPVLEEAVRQLRLYFEGRLRQFDVALELEGTAFQQQVWAELRRIPFGETRSYAEIARAIGRPSALRAVGAANGANPVPIIVPCHRVIGADGSLTGFGGGLDLKKRLLALEAWYMAPLSTTSGAAPIAAAG